MARAGIKLKTYDAMPGCTLGKMRASGCIGSTCDGCGWNQDEIAHRNKLLARNGLTEGPDGLRRLIIR